MIEKQKRSAFFIQRSVIFALFMRELKTRFDSPVQYVYALLNPLVQVLAFAAFFWIMGRKSRMEGVPITMFLVTGIIPWLFFRVVVSRSMGVVESNAGLFFYRQVKPIDTVVTRVLLELVIYTSIFIILIGIFGALGDPVAVEDPAKLLLVYIVFVIFTFSTGTALLIVNFHYPIVGNIFNILFRFFYFTSGVFFPITVIPAKYREYMLYNPIVHVMEMSRDAYFISYTSEYGSWQYLLFSTLVMLVFALALYRVNRYALLNPST